MPKKETDLISAPESLYRVICQAKLVDQIVLLLQLIDQIPHIFTVVES